MEQRNFTRVDFSAAAAIKCNDKVILGDITNVSLQGLFIKTGEIIPENQPVYVTVYQYPSPSFSLHADIIRQERNGAGMRISKIDMQSFAHLRNAVAMQSDDHDVIINETFRMSDCIQIIQ